MTREGFNRISKLPVRRPVARKIKGKEPEQIKSFTNIINGELEHFVKVIAENRNHRKSKRFN